MVSAPAAALADANQRPELRARFVSSARRQWPVWLIVAVAISFRLIDVGWLPGMQGDEAWYGLQARLLLAGDAVQWRTPTGNVPGMIQIGSLTLLHALFPPSLLLLRIPTLLSSLLAIATAYSIGRRFLSPGSAIVALLLMACLPINIVYARFGWDPSHSALLVLLAVYATWLRRRLLAALAFALAMTNHPSAVFVAPFLTLTYLGFDLPSHELRRAIANTLSFAVLLLIAIAFVMLLSPATGQYLDAGKSFERIFNPLTWTNFMVSLSALISGQTSYFMMMGQGFGALRPAIDVLILLALFATASGSFWLAFRRQPDWPLLGIVSGWLASLLLLYLAAGPWVFRAGLERFGLPMMPITVLAVAAVLGRWSEKQGSGRLALPLAVVAGSLMLAGFWYHYLSAGDQPGGRPGQGYWTAVEDPGAMAFKGIARAAGPDGGATIIAENWWIAEPIAYYAAGTRIHIVQVDEQPQRAPDLASPTYWVSLAGGELDRSLAGQGQFQLYQVVATNHPLNKLHIWRQMPAHAAAIGSPRH